MPTYVVEIVTSDVIFRVEVKANSSYDAICRVCEMYDDVKTATIVEVHGARR